MGRCNNKSVVLIVSTNVSGTCNIIGWMSPDSHCMFDWLDLQVFHLPISLQAVTTASDVASFVLFAVLRLWWLWLKVGAPLLLYPAWDCIQGRHPPWSNLEKSLLGKQDLWRAVAPWDHLFIARAAATTTQVFTPWVVSVKCHTASLVLEHEFTPVYHKSKATITYVLHSLISSFNGLFIVSNFF